MSDEKLKARLKEMDKSKLNKLKDMAEFVFIKLLKRLQMMTKGEKSNFNSLSREKLLNLKNRLDQLQQFINKANNNLFIMNPNIFFGGYYFIYQSIHLGYHQTS